MPTRERRRRLPIDGKQTTRLLHPRETNTSLRCQLNTTRILLIKFWTLISNYIRHVVRHSPAQLPQTVRSYPVPV